MLNSARCCDLVSITRSAPSARTEGSVCEAAILAARVRFGSRVDGARKLVTAWFELGRRLSPSLLNPRDYRGKLSPHAGQ